MRRALVMLALIPFALQGCGEEQGEPADQQGDTPTLEGAPSGPEGASSSDAQEAASEAQETAQQGAEEASGEVTEAARSTMTSYLDQMTSLASSLEGVENRIGAAAKAPEMQSTLDQVLSLQEELNALPTQTLDALKAEFNAQLSSVTERLQTQIDRISNDPDLAGTLGELVQQIPTSLG